MMIKKTLLIGTMLFTIVFTALPQNISLTDRVYGISQFWKEVNYNFVYF